MIPTDTAGRWDYVDSLVRRWFPPGEQAAEPELSNAARRLGPLSPALAALAARAARHVVWGVQDTVLAPDDWRPDDTRLVIAREAQGATEWAVPLGEIAADDPPVDLRDPDSGRWVREFSSVSEFAVGWVLLAVKFSGADLPRANGQVPYEAVDRLRAEFDVLSLRLTWPADPTWFVSLPDALVEVDGGAWAWVTARDRGAYEAAMTELTRLGMELDESA